MDQSERDDLLAQLARECARADKAVAECVRLRADRAATLDAALILSAELDAAKRALLAAGQK